jgi:hypothetical protein
MDYDASEFIDADFQPQKSPASGGPASSGQLLRAPTREEVDTRVAEAHQKLAELKRAQEQLERERNAVEEIRRRQHEYHSGRQEMVQNLTRGAGLLEKAEFEARRDSEQMAKTLVEFREALGRIQAIHEETWTQENLNAELTKALTTLENSRMEWNTARLKFQVLSGPAQAGNAGGESAAGHATVLAGYTFGQLCRIGLALTLPLAITLLALAALIFVLARH